ncbi:hypothetical protein USB125703_00693 [Pseudoclavibacter triregionum]|nr:hypothetical protein USB125703_00693 [Pseudoclavibacter triregionum]
MIADLAGFVAAAVQLAEGSGSSDGVFVGLVAGALGIFSVIGGIVQLATGRGKPVERWRRGSSNTRWAPWPIPGITYLALGLLLLAVAGSAFGSLAG